MSDASFRLPKGPSFGAGDAVFSSSEALRGTLGRYESGGAPIIFDPFYTGDGTSFATLVHENMHQMLTINTAFGSLDVVLRSAAKHGMHSSECVMSHEAQWSVQELNATYAELVAVAINRPEELAGAFERLQSSMLDQQPCREVVDAIARHLPIDEKLGAARLMAQQHVVCAIAACSFSNDCLVAFTNRASMNPVRFEEYLRRDSPAVRFERIVNQLLAVGRLGQLVDALTPRMAAMEEGGETPTLGPEIEQVASTVDVYIERRDLRPLCTALADDWNAHSEKSGHSWRVVLKELPGGLPARMEDHPANVAERLKEIHRSATLGDSDFADRIASVVETGDGLAMMLSIRDPSAAFVSLSTYATHGGPLPAPPSPGFAPRDWSGVVSADVIVDTLERFPGLPHVLQFMRDSWLRWPAMTTGRRVATSAVRVVVQTELSLEWIRDLLEFDDVGSNPRFFVVGWKGKPFWSYIANPANLGHYLRFKTPAGAGITLFLGIMQQLGIGTLDRSEELEHFDLLNMLLLMPY